MLKKLDSKSFPLRKYATASGYAADYFAEIAQAATTIEPARLDQAAEALSDCIRNGGIIYACGNGGSAAISEHFCCDALKTLRSDTQLTPRIVSLSSTSPIVTAIANDFGYAEIFSRQLDSMLRPADVLVTISSSGESENIVRAIALAKSRNATVISLTGFDGGRAKSLATIDIHVDSKNYGIVEDLHQSVLHVLVHYLRQLEMTEDMVRDRTF